MTERYTVWYGVFADAELVNYIKDLWDKLDGELGKGMTIIGLSKPRGVFFTFGFGLLHMPDAPLGIFRNVEPLTADKAIMFEFVDEIFSDSLLKRKIKPGLAFLDMKESGAKILRRPTIEEVGTRRIGMKTAKTKETAAETERLLPGRNKRERGILQHQRDAGVADENEGGIDMSRVLDYLDRAAENEAKSQARSGAHKPALAVQTERLREQLQKARPKRPQKSCEEGKDSLHGETDLFRKRRRQTDEPKDRTDDECKTPVKKKTKGIVDLHEKFDKKASKARMIVPEVDSDKENSEDDEVYDDADE
jgi:hypothetical protein